jgi:hypothetical protein
MQKSEIFQLSTFNFQLFFVPLYPNLEDYGLFAKK